MTDSFYQDIFTKFIEYLVNVIRIKDPDVEFFRAMARHDFRAVMKSFQAGTDPSIAPDTIICRYSRYYYAQFRFDNNVR